jgi:hypothetical protein
VVAREGSSAREGVRGESFFDGFDLRSERRDDIEIGDLEVRF